VLSERTRDLPPTGNNRAGSGGQGHISIPVGVPLGGKGANEGRSCRKQCGEGLLCTDCHFSLLTSGLHFSYSYALHNNAAVSAGLQYI
jgi:hypothetical protein